MKSPILISAAVTVLFFATGEANDKFVTTNSSTQLVEVIKQLHSLPKIDNQEQAALLQVVSKALEITSRTNADKQDVTRTTKPMLMLADGDRSW